METLYDDHMKRSTEWRAKAREDTRQAFWDAHEKTQEEYPAETPEERAAAHEALGELAVNFDAPHYVAMAGLRGYMPSVCEVFDDVESAVDYLATVHDLGRRRRAELKRDLSLELNRKRDGNEYCDIVPCECDDPSVHSESGI